LVIVLITIAITSLDSGVSIDIILRVSFAFVSDMMLILVEFDLLIAVFAGDFLCGLLVTAIVSLIVQILIQLVSLINKIVMWVIVKAIVILLVVLLTFVGVI